MCQFKQCVIHLYAILLAKTLLFVFKNNLFLCYTSGLSVKTRPNEAIVSSTLLSYSHIALLTQPSTIFRLCWLNCSILAKIVHPLTFMRQSGILLSYIYSLICSLAFSWIQMQLWPALPNPRSLQEFCHSFWYQVFSCIHIISTITKGLGTLITRGRIGLPRLCSALLCMVWFSFA